MDTEHTPLPWTQIDGEGFDEGQIIITTQQRVERSFVPIAIVDADFSEPMNSEQIANAALIVHSVNLHDELVFVLKAARFYVPNTDTSGHLCATIDALLAKATS